jgi:hypothetical protein
MQPRVDVITLGVQDLERALRFSRSGRMTEPVGQAGDGNGGNDPRHEVPRSFQVSRDIPAHSGKPAASRPAAGGLRRRAGLSGKLAVSHQPSTASLAHRSPPLAHTLDETLQHGEPVVPDLRVAEVDTDDGHQLSGRRRAARREETLVALREAGLTRAGHQPGGKSARPKRYPARAWSVCSVRS